MHMSCLSSLLATMFFKSKITNWIAPSKLVRQSASKEEAPPKPAKAEPKTLKISLGYMSYVIYEAVWLERLPYPYNDELPDAAFLVVELSVTNIDDSSSTIPPFQLVDSRGAEFDTSYKAWRLKRALGTLESLNPGVTKRGTILFDLPRKSDYKLKLSGGILSGKSTMVEIHLR